MIILQTKEHSKFDKKTCEEIIKPLALDFSCTENEIKFLKLNSNFETTYIIGIDWLVENKVALVVEPKIEQLDFLKMFMECFNNDLISKDLNRIYKIQFNKKPIQLSTSKFELTPMMVIHFLNTLKNIVKRGLKKDYIRVENNLQSKVKGKILFNRTLKQNIFQGRKDRNYCNYQEYSDNCIENQILKKALSFIKVYLTKNFQGDKELLNSLNYCFGAFEDIDEDVDVKRIKQFKINPLYKDYSEALRLAKMIFKRFSYSISEVAKVSDNKFPPFYIDMSLLFELFVFSKLRKQFGKNILYQSKGRYGYTDFLKIDEKIIIDTKYKLKYADNYIIDDIRQLSGYARDKGILKKLQIVGENNVVDCVIIYPNKDSMESFSERDLKESEIEQFIKFYKCGIRLPVK